MLIIYYLYTVNLCSLRIPLGLAAYWIFPDGAADSFRARTLSLSLYNPVYDCTLHENGQEYGIHVDKGLVDREPC